jgi:hypothetical protein
MPRARVAAGSLAHFAAALQGNRGGMPAPSCNWAAPVSFRISGIWRVAGGPTGCIAPGSDSSDWRQGSETRCRPFSFSGRSGVGVPDPQRGEGLCGRDSRLRTRGRIGPWGRTRCSPVPLCAAPCMAGDVSTCYSSGLSGSSKQRVGGSIPSRGARESAICRVGIALAREASRREVAFGHAALASEADSRFPPGVPRNRQCAEWESPSLPGRSNPMASGNSTIYREQTPSDI